MLKPVQGFLIEYGVALPPLVLAFDFNPQQITRNRSVTLTLGSTPATRGGFDFMLPTETARVAQGVSVEPESFDLEILLDATDRMNDGEELARTMGVEPELATLRSMVEPKTQGPAGVQVLAGLSLDVGAEGYSVRGGGEIEKTNPSALAAVYAQLGEPDEALAWLARAAAAHAGPCTTCR